MESKQRRRDDEFGLLLNKKGLAEYIGVSQALVNELILHEGLGETSFTPTRGGNTFFIRPKVDEWIMSKGE
ncbi:hypothetical protein [Pediococcus argentinicus]|uniref:Helix-turn-helix domain-containing protein n=1 Tax=Pediococcus argentinicus TaxID=480391 RepID=A0A0R2NC89_9LACO|nr:hypothetical protein [Pediococcus argentinicus]KRO23512.1 hypothetical protein IV88_GL000909 [Pediococcus argentinicus]NKZ22905.1 hypothetical protein [Pediococcus argentinicus]GEP19944.1 hypothetical protein LSA03_13280 [Pediococcus argentinicus]